MLGFLILAILIISTEYFSMNESKTTLKQSIGHEFTSFAVRVLDQIDRTMYNRIEELMVYSTDSLLQDYLKQSNQEFEKLENIQEYITVMDNDWLSVPKTDLSPFMQELISNDLSKELRDRIYFYSDNYGYPVYGEIFVTNSYGANAAQTGKTSDYRQDDEEWWQKAKEYGLYVRDVEYDESANIYSTDIGLRIDDEDGNFIGVLKAVLNIEESIALIQQAEKDKAFKTLDIELLTYDGKVLYSAEPHDRFEVTPHSDFLNFLGTTGFITIDGDSETELIAFAHYHQDFFSLILSLQRPTGVK